MSEKKVALLILAFVFLFPVALHYAKVADAKHHTIILDDRYWQCTETKTIPIGMARGKECIKWERKP